MSSLLFLNKRIVRYCKDVLGSPRPLLLWGFSKRIHRIQHTGVPAAKTENSNVVRQLIRRGEGTGKKWRNPCSYAGLLSGEVPQNMSLSEDVQQHVGAVSTQGSPLETQRPSFVLGPCHVCTLCLAWTRIPEPQKESRFSA